jgi:3-deoxy-manno-octulosonate cytidylyltransferase (CMP-KDO synthetase)
MLCVEVDAKGREFWEVNNPEDIPLIEKMFGAHHA